MLDFVIVNDDKKFNNIVKESITKIMFNEDSDYCIHIFNNYSSTLNNLIHSSKDYVYIIDINVNGKSGLEIAKEIRKEDWISPIIFITNYNVNLEAIIQGGFFALDLIYKFENNFQEKISKDIKHIIDIKNKDKFITLKEHNSIINIPIKDILYITKDTESRKIQIVTSFNKTYLLNYTLNSLLDKLNNNFIKSHRACIININRVKEIDIKTNQIIFDNNTTTYLISRNYKKDVINKLKLKN